MKKYFCDLCKNETNFLYNVSVEYEIQCGQGEAYHIEKIKQSREVCTSCQDKIFSHVVSKEEMLEFHDAT